MPNHITNQLYVTDSGSHTQQEIIKSCLNDEGFFDFNKIAPVNSEYEGHEPHHAMIQRAQNAMGIPLHKNEMLARLEQSNRIDLCFTPIRSDSEEERKEEIDGVIRCLQMYRDTGYFYWHDQQCDLWGTKWNAYAQPEQGYSGDEKFIQFETAWGTPEPVFIALSKKYPDATFKIVYADEDTGSNCGVFSLKNGEIIESDIAPSWRDQTEEERTKWTKFACELKGYDYEEYIAEQNE